MRTQDDGSRVERGLCISVRRVGDTVELTFDDVRLKDSAPYQALWKHETFITFAEMSAEELEIGLSDERFARFGRLVWGMLGRSVIS